MNTKRRYKTYTSEFKTEALALLSEQGYTVQEAASALGIEKHQWGRVLPFANMLYIERN